MPTVFLLQGLGIKSRSKAEEIIMKQRNFRMIETNGIRLRTVVEGEGPLVILLHGFPQCWYLWRHKIDPLVEAGFQVAVPDQRGVVVVAGKVVLRNHDDIQLVGTQRIHEYVGAPDIARRAV